MILKLLVSGLVLVGGFFAVTVPVPQDEKAEKMKKLMEVMERCAKAAVPTEAHQKLAKMAGKWNQDWKMMMPDSPTMESKGTCEYKSIVGGRFLTADVLGQIPGPEGKPMPFNGFQLLGYDNVNKKYQAVWCDSMGTGFWLSSGTADASGKVITLEGTIKDAMAPEARAFKMIMTLESEDKHLLEWWDTYEGKLTKMGVITETRAK